MSMTALCLFLVFVALQALDAYTTYRDLQLPGRYEANPFMRKLMLKIGVIPALAATKIVVISALGIFAVYTAMPAAYLVLPDVLFALVVLNNFKQGKA